MEAKISSFCLQHTNSQTLALTHLDSERTLSFLLGLRATLLQKASNLQPAEIQCKNLLNSPIFSGGLQNCLQPSNPFDEEKGEARSSTSTAGSTPTESSHVNLTEISQPIHWPNTVNNRIIFENEENFIEFIYFS